MPEPSLEIKKEEKVPQLEIDPKYIEGLGLIAQVVGGDFGMKIKVGEAGVGSYFNPEKVEIVFDPLHILEDLDQAKFIAAHEGGHRAITRGFHEMGMREEKIKEISSQLGLAYIQNCLEDPADNNWFTRKYAGLKNITEEVYNKMLGEELVPLGLTHPEVQMAVSRLGYIPRFVYFGSEIIRDWHKGRFSQGLDPEVKKTLEKIRDKYQEYFETIPKKYANEREIKEKARERFINFYQNIWPEAKRIIEEDMNDEKLRQMLEKEKEEILQKLKELEEQRQKELEKELNEQKKKGEELEKEIKDIKEKMEGAEGEEKENLEKKLKEKQGEKEENEKKQKELEKEQEKSLADRIKEGIEKAKKEQEKQKKDLEKKLEEKKKQGEDLDKQIEDLKKQIEKAEGEQKKDLEQKLAKKQGEKKQNQRKQKELKKEIKDLEKQEKEGEFPFPMDKLSETDKKMLKEIFDQLPEEEKEELEEKAKRSLEDLEDQLNKEMQGKLNQDNPESHEQRREREKKEEEERKREEEERERERRREKERKEARKKIEEKIEELKSEYDKYYEEVVDIIDDLYKRLEKIFLPQRHPRWKAGYPAGTRLNLLKAMQFEAARRLKIPSEEYRKMFERKTLPDKRDYKFMFLVDMSDSMHEGGGEKIKETFKGLIVLGEVLNRLGIDFAIYGFTDEFPENVKKYKSFDEELTEEVRNRLSGVLTEGKGSTPTSSATEIASQELGEHKGKNNFLVTLTDGIPFPEDSSLTKNLVKKIREETDQKLVGLGLGPGTEFVENFYPAAQGNIKIEQLPEVLSQLLEDMILYPEKY